MEAQLELDPKFLASFFPIIPRPQNVHQCNVPALDHYVYANAMVLLYSIKLLPFWLSSAKIVLSVLKNEYLITEEYEY